MNRFLGLVLVLVLGAGTTACGGNEAKTVSFVAGVNVTALLGVPGGGLRYATSEGAIFDASSDGEGTQTPVATVSGASKEGVLGLVADQDNRTFASWVDAASSKLVVAQIAPGPQRVIFRSERAPRESAGGRMALSAENRIILSFNEADTASILSIDPDRNDDQRANVVSQNWNEVAGVAYATGRVLWALDDGDGNNGRIARVGPDGPVGVAALRRQRARRLSRRAR
jgi:hypothetical protein